MRSIFIGFGLLILCLLILFKLGEWNVMQENVQLEVVVAVAALVFFFIGIYFNRQSAKNDAGKTASPGTIDQENLKRSGLTAREHEVLIKMAEGMSNQEIASSMYLSESTIKTHVSNILFKLDAKRRTQAIQIAKTNGLVP